MRRDKKRGGNQTQETRCKHGEIYDISRKNVLNVAVSAGCGGYESYLQVYIIVRYIYIYIYWNIHEVLCTCYPCC